MLDPMPIIVFQALLRCSVILWNAHMCHAPAAGHEGVSGFAQGFDKKADAMEDWPACAKVAVQQSVAQTGEIATPVVSETDLLEVPGAPLQCLADINDVPLDTPPPSGAATQAKLRMEK